MSCSLICSGESFFTRFLVSYPLITLSRPRVAQTPAAPAATPIAIDFSCDSFSDSWVCFSFLSCDKNWGSDFWCGSQATSPACKSACIFSWLLDELEAKVWGVSLTCILVPVKTSFFNTWSSSSVFLVSISVLFSFMKAKIWFAMSGVTKLIIFFHHQNSLTSSNFWGRSICQIRTFLTSSLIGKRTSDFRNPSCSLKSSKYLSEISDFNCSIATIYQIQNKINLCQFRKDFYRGFNYCKKVITTFEKLLLCLCRLESICKRLKCIISNSGTLSLKRENCRII